MKKAIFVTLGVLFLSACFGHRTPMSQFYTLTPLPDKPVSETVAVSVGVDRIQLPQSLNRPQMVTQYIDSPDVTLSEFNRWIEPLAPLIQRTMVTDLAQALPASVIKDKSFSRESFTYSVQVDVIQMNTVLEREAGWLAWVTVYGKTGKQVTRFKTAETVPVGKTYADMASAYSRLVDKMARQIARSIVELHR